MSVSEPRLLSVVTHVHKGVNRARVPAPVAEAELKVKLFKNMARKVIKYSNSLLAHLCDKTRAFWCENYPNFTISDIVQYLVKERHTPSPIHHLSDRALLRVCVASKDFAGLEISRGGRRDGGTLMNMC